MEPFVKPGSIVRTIWGRGDTILLIFAGASAEFALNRSVDWLYFTGRLPKDPLGRLFSTVSYARRIVFADEQDANAAIDHIAAIHQGVEKARGYRISAGAYLDVLFMLIDYSIRAYELVERKMSAAEKEEVFSVFRRVGRRMGLTGLPATYTELPALRETHLRENLVRSEFSRDLYRQYRKHLGAVRYFVLLQAQVLLVPDRVRCLLRLPSIPFLYPVIQLYKAARLVRLDRGIKYLLLPPEYREQVFGLDSLT
ncbi:MAG TPA: oxygenase MpaB family protein [Puia sp.]|nr:oxygenase MpaB family protein [Puia sp.]